MSGPQSREGVARPLGVADAGARTMGERLAAVRHQLGFSQRRAAELSGLTHGAICMIEQDKVSPSVASLQKLLTIYGLPLSRFFAEEENRTPEVVIKADQLIELGSQGSPSSWYTTATTVASSALCWRPIPPAPTPAVR